MAQQKFKVTISKDYNPSERVALGVEIIEAIIERSQKGRDKDGKKFPKYSKSYESSFDFKLAGKKKGQTPNLTLSGEMLNALEVLSHRSGEITIGIPKDDEFNNAKAEGNIKGTYGGKPTGKVRDFMGIKDSDLDKITNRFPTEAGRSSNNDLLKTLLATEAAREIADNFLDIERLESRISDDTE